MTSIAIRKMQSVSFLNVANGYAPLDGTAKFAGLGSADTGEKQANKGAVSGYAPLNAGQIVPNANLPTIPCVTYVGNGSDGVVTISCCTDLGAANSKQYCALTVNTGKKLTANTGAIIRVKNTLTLTGTAQIHVDGKVGTGGAGGVLNGGCQRGGTGGKGGGSLQVYANKILGCGVISANGANGTNGTGNAAGACQTAGIGGSPGSGDAQQYGLAVANTHGLGATSYGCGGGGAAFYGDGGGPRKGTAISTPALSFGLLQGHQGSAGGGGGARRVLSCNRFEADGGGAGSGGAVAVYSATTISTITVRANGGNGGYGATSGLGFARGGGGGGGLALALAGTTNCATVTACGGTGCGTAATAGIALKVVI